MAVQQLLIRDSATNLPKEYSPTQTSSGAGSAGLPVALNSAGQIDGTMLPASNGMPTLSVLASEAIAAGAVVNLWSNAGTLNVRNANATDATKPACGFAAAAIASGVTGAVSFDGALNNGASGLTIGAPVFLSAATAGGVTTTAPSATGNLVQQVGGAAISATEYLFSPKLGIIHG